MSSIFLLFTLDYVASLGEYQSPYTTEQSEMESSEPLKKASKKSPKRYSTLGEDLVELNLLKEDLDRNLHLIPKATRSFLDRLMRQFSPEGELAFLRKVVPDILRDLDPPSYGWVTGEMPSFEEPMSEYVALIRATLDPERTPRELAVRDMNSLWRRKLLKEDVADIMLAIEKHMEDCKHRTLNRISVEMIDKTADLIYETPFEKAVWNLVVNRKLEFTLDAPVFFRKTVT